MTRLIPATVAALAIMLAWFALLAFTAPPADAHGDRWRTNSYSRWVCLSHYESTHRWHYNGPSDHDGGLQFAPRTWTAYTGPDAPDYAWQASKRFQIKVARRVAFHGFGRHAPHGMGAWSAWGACR